MSVVDSQRDSKGNLRWKALVSVGTRAALCLLVTAMLGCQEAGPERAAVTGIVEFDGKPLETGSIAFIPNGAEGGPSSGSTIENGKYSIPKENGAVVGSHRVEIRWPKKTGKQIPVVPPATSATGVVDEVEEGLPAKYNTKSTLVETVESGPNSIDFHLTTD